jgi:hypothetical protein
MPAVASSWLIGSITIPQQDFTSNGFACSVPAGTYYLYHSTSALSLVNQFDGTIENETGVSANQTRLRRSRLLLSSWTAPVSVTWGSATQLRDLLGYTGNLGAGTDHLATNISPLLWSPGYPATPKTIPGVLGYPVDHKTQYKSDDGSQLHTDFYSEETWQDLEWTHIVPSRMRVATGTGGGTFHEFYRQVTRIGSRFFHYESVTEDTSDSTTEATLTGGLGPYVTRELSGDYYERRVQGADISSPLRLPLHVVDEVS